eukprot:COSAG01_NODE_836_length_13206_cov_139.627375_14_plen_232_part_00
MFVWGEGASALACSLRAPAAAAGRPAGLSPCSVCRARHGQVPAAAAALWLGLWLSLLLVSRWYDTFPDGVRACQSQIHRDAAAAADVGGGGGAQQLLRKLDETGRGPVWPSTGQPPCGVEAEADVLLSLLATTDTAAAAAAAVSHSCVCIGSPCVIHCVHGAPIGGGGGGGPADPARELWSAAHRLTAGALPGAVPHPLPQLCGGHAARSARAAVALADAAPGPRLPRPGR